MEFRYTAGAVGKVMAMVAAAVRSGSGDARSIGAWFSFCADVERVEFIQERLTFDADASDFLATFQLHLMGAFAQMERAISKDRQREGIDLARARGAYLGRAKRLAAGDIAEARRLVREGVPKAVIARRLECSRQVLYDALNSRGAYAPDTSPRPPMAGGAREVELPL